MDFLVSSKTQKYKFNILFGKKSKPTTSLLSYQEFALTRKRKLYPTAISDTDLKVWDYMNTVVQKVIAELSKLVS